MRKKNKKKQKRSKRREKKKHKRKNVKDKMKSMRVLMHHQSQVNRQTKQLLVNLKKRTQLR